MDKGELTLANGTVVASKAWRGDRVQKGSIRCALTRVAFSAILSAPPPRSAEGSVLEGVPDAANRMPVGRGRALPAHMPFARPAFPVHITQSKRK